jgi:hypothetical protein
MPVYLPNVLTELRELRFFPGVKNSNGQEWDSLDCFLFPPSLPKIQPRAAPSSQSNPLSLHILKLVNHHLNQSSINLQPHRQSITKMGSQSPSFPPFADTILFTPLPLGAR